MQAHQESKDMQGRAAVQGFSGCTPSDPVQVLARLELASQLKTEGNNFYREKNIRSAIGRYHRSLLVLRSLDSTVLGSVKTFGPVTPLLSTEQEDTLRNTQVDCYNNLSACLLQKPSVDYARVREYSKRVLQWRPKDVKALYRAGVAALEMGDAWSAKECLNKACIEQPNDANVKKYLKKAQNMLNEELRSERARFRTLFLPSM